MSHVNLQTRSAAIVECVHPVDLGGGPYTGDYIHMRGYDGALVCCYIAALFGVETITVQQCTQDNDAGSDAKAIGSGKTITAVANSIRSVNIAAPELDVDNRFEWLKITTNIPGQGTLGCLFVICYRARYAEAVMPSPLI